MSEFLERTPRGPALSDAEVLARFEGAWKQSLASGAEPAIADFLKLGSESERETLRHKLEELSARYRRERVQKKQAGPGTVDFSQGHQAQADTPPPPAGSTMEFDSSGDTGAGIPGTIAVGAAVEDDDGFEYDDRTQVRSDAADETRTVDRPVVAGYEILGELGRGGMGVVYKARQIKLDRTVALKMVLAGAHAGSDQLRRFNAEAQAVAHLQHPNIVQIYEVSEQAGLPYFSLEFVDGGSLAQKAAGKPQPEREAAQMVETLARAMHYAHQNHVVHRDLKPANVLLTHHGAPKITDFGLAKRLEDESSSQTRSGAILGTPSYMAPEQAMGEVHEIGPLTDVYSLGAILYELLTGRPPFAGPTPMDTVVQVTRDEPVPPSQLQPKVPRDLETICLKCLQKEQAKRYASAQALADDLARFLAGEPILARPISTPERLWRWCRRNPRTASLSAAVLALLVAGCIGSTYAAITIAQERNAKEEQRKEAETAKTAAQIAERHARQNAHIAEQQAVNAVDVFYRVVTKADSKLRTMPGEGISDLRLAILGDTEEGMDQVLEGMRDSPLFNRTMAALQQHVGDVYHQLGRIEDAQSFYEKCRAIIEQMVRENPDSDANIFNIGSIYEKLGRVAMELEDLGVARDFHRKSLEYRLRLTQMPITDPQLSPEKVKESLANAYWIQSSLSLMLGDPAASWESLGSMLDLQIGKRYSTPGELLTDLESGKLAPQYERVSFVLRAGELSFRLNDVESCRAFYRRAMSRSAAALAKQPERRDARAAVHSAASALGDLHLLLRDPAGAKPHYDKAHELVVALADEDPDNAGLKRLVSLSHYRIATAQLLSNGTGPALEHYRECLAIRQKLAEADPRNVHKQIDLMVALARCGQHREAADVAEKLGSRAAEDPSVLFQVACGFALCLPAIELQSTQNEPNEQDRTQMADYAARAIDAVREAIKKGYRDRVQLSNDPDLLPIQQMPEFQQAVASIE